MWMNLFASLIVAVACNLEIIRLGLELRSASETKFNRFPLIAMMAGGGASVLGLTVGSHLTHTISTPWFQPTCAVVLTFIGLWAFYHGTSTRFDGIAKRPIDNFDKHMFFLIVVAISQIAIGISASAVGLSHVIVFITGLASCALAWIVRDLHASS